MSPNRLTSNRRRSDLLIRPPMLERSSTPAVSDPLVQLRALVDLLGRGLLSDEEFEHHKAKVLAL